MVLCVFGFTELLQLLVYQRTFTSAAGLWSVLIALIFKALTIQTEMNTVSLTVMTWITPITASNKSSSECLREVTTSAFEKKKS